MSIHISHELGLEEQPMPQPICLGSGMGTTNQLHKRDLDLRGTLSFARHRDARPTQLRTRKLRVLLNGNERRLRLKLKEWQKARVSQLVKETRQYPPKNAKQHSQ